MKSKLRSLSEQYLNALRSHLKAGPKASLDPALELGLQAAALGLKPIELARIHQAALAQLAAQLGNATNKRAELFFAEAACPIQKLVQQRGVDLSVANRGLQLKLLRGRSVERALRHSAAHYQELLAQSLRIQKGLRQKTHQALVEQEDGRQKLSRELQDEIEQILLAINLRLICLKQIAQAKRSDLKNEIASAQALIVRSAAAMRRVARKIESHD